jgi:hypothetical protein
VQLEPVLVPLQFREFLQTYNMISELCFSRCVLNLNNRGMSKEEVLLTSLLLPETR